jgi:hypothetical protein
MSTAKKFKLHHAVSASLMMGCNSLLAATTFTDGKFDLSNYSIEYSQTGGASVAVIQHATGGNPGFTIEGTVNAPAASGKNFQSAQLIINDTFVYDPSVQGGIQSIDASIDVYVQVPSFFTNASKAGSLLLKQGQNYFSYSSALPFVQASFATLTANGLTARDFNLITDLTSSAANSNIHPDFTNGPAIKFGFLGGVYTTIGTPSSTVVWRVDNLSYSISAVPEPAPLVLIFAGALTIAIRRKTALSARL